MVSDVTYLQTLTSLWAQFRKSDRSSFLTQVLFSYIYHWKQLKSLFSSQGHPLVNHTADHTHSFLLNCTMMNLIVIIHNDHLFIKFPKIPAALQHLRRTTIKIIFLSFPNRPTSSLSTYPLHETETVPMADDGFILVIYFSANFKEISLS